MCIKAVYVICYKFNPIHELLVREKTVPMEILTIKGIELKWTI